MRQVPISQMNHSSWSNYWYCYLISRVNDHERANESNVQGEYNGVSSQREQPNQWLKTYDRIQHSNRPDLQKKQRKKGCIVRPTIESVKQPSTSNEFQNSKSTHISSSSPTLILTRILESCKSQTKRMSLIHWIYWSKSLLKSRWMNMHRIRILKAHKHEQNCLQVTNWSNHEVHG
jgi:hypothetical protein